MGFNSLRRFLTNDKHADGNICLFWPQPRDETRETFPLGLVSYTASLRDESLRQRDVFVSSPFCFFGNKQPVCFGGKVRKRLKLYNLPLLVRGCNYKLLLPG